MRLREVLLRGVGGAAAISLLIAGCSSASFEVDPEIEGGLHRYVHATAGVEHDYLLSVPDEYLEAPGEPWPLVVYLHGYAGGGGHDLDALETSDVPAVVARRPYRFIMAAPYADSGDFHTTEFAWFHSTEYLHGLIGHVGEQVLVDPNRIYLVGGSWGATGVWALASAYPDLAAAIVTVSGGWSDRCPSCGWPEDVTGLYPDNICELSDIPTWIVHGDLDRSVPVEVSLEIASALEECGGEVRLEIQEGRGHGARVIWPDVFEWLLHQGHDEEWPVVTG